MFCIDSPYTDVNFNLAAEEYLLKNSQESFFLLYRNEPSVVLGKFQSTITETDIDFLKKHDIKLARRISGGGAVYHDMGNVNFTFITSVEKGNPHKFTADMATALEKLGAHTQIGARHDLSICGHKISGSADCVHKDRVLHHGTLLFSSNLHCLTGALNGKPETASVRTVRSVKSAVTNLAEFLSANLSIDEFKNFLFKHFLLQSQDNHLYIYDGADYKSIMRLRDEKYLSPSWVTRNF